MADEESTKETSVEDKEKKSETTPKEDPKEGTFTREQVNEMLEKVRKQEKDKLYGKIEDLSTTVKTLSDAAKTDQEQKEKAEKEANEKAQKEREAKMSAEEKQSELLRKLEEQLAEQKLVQEAERKARETLEQNLEREREKSKLSEYKAEILKDAGADIIPEMVDGESRDEIDRSVAQAKARYKDIFEAAVSKAGGRDPRIPGPANPDTALDEQAVSAGLTADILRKRQEGKLSQDYVKNREEIMDQVAAQYGRLMGR